MFGMVVCSRVLGASGRARGYTQPFQTITETKSNNHNKDIDFHNVLFPSVRSEIN